MVEYTVLVDDNFHYQEEDERTELGTFNSYEEAVVACRRIVDDFLQRCHRVGMTAEELYSQYTSFGDDPFIRPDGPVPRFSAWSYARQRCDDICGG